MQLFCTVIVALMQAPLPPPPGTALAETLEQVMNLHDT